MSLGADVGPTGQQNPYAGEMEVTGIGPQGEVTPLPTGESPVATGVDGYAGGGGSGIPQPVRGVCKCRDDVTKQELFEAGG